MFEFMKEYLSYEDAISFLVMFAIALIVHLFCEIGIAIFKKVHCHRIMKSGKKHQCHYWTCCYYQVCPYNSCDVKLPKRTSDSVHED